MELMVAVGIVGILLAVAAPSFRDTIMNVRMTAQTNDLMADLALARSEASKRNVNVFLCASSNQTQCNSADWSTGWLVFADTNSNNRLDVGEVPIKSRPLAEGRNVIRSRGHAAVGPVPHVPFKPAGTTGIALIAFGICDTRTTPLAGRRIEITATGRPQVIRETCPFAP